jgi:ABC-type sulfate transport system permease component
MESDLRGAQALSIILVVSAFALLFVLRRMAPSAELPGAELRGA